MSYIGHEIKKTHNLIFRVLEAHSKNGYQDLTYIDRQFCAYIYHNENKPIYQKDLEKEFSLRRSSASEQLRKMEEKGLIIREQTHLDKRLKRIVLTDKAHQQMDKSFQEVKKFEALIASGLSGGEIENLISTLQKIQNNLLTVNLDGQN